MRCSNGSLASRTVRSSITPVLEVTYVTTFLWNSPIFGKVVGNFQLELRVLYQRDSTGQLNAFMERDSLKTAFV
jgi:hypothetical protein